MSKFHGEQYWTDMRHQTLYGWRDLSDDDFDTWRAIRVDREARARATRGRSRRDRDVTGVREREVEN